MSAIIVEQGQDGDLLQIICLQRQTKSKTSQPYPCFTLIQKLENKTLLMLFHYDMSAYKCGAVPQIAYFLLLMQSAKQLAYS